ncbi:hypothetical protein [Yeosuana marina]|uniref:hypothetical protein n=1 Tax=Yeosuana marina TaxID=1565536 RepID=UPI0030EE1651|tara:strand:- start:2356 stop:3084 length:729 start_codon:yes stop_codon:yes gene_type:complete
MKKKLESELVSIAHRILKLKGKEDVIKMHAEVSVLFEKLSVLKFAHENFDDNIPSIGNDSSFFGMLDNAFNNTLSDTIEVEDKIYINLDDVEHDDIMEPGMKTIRDMVEHMPEEDKVFKEPNRDKQKKREILEDLTAGFENLPQFEPVVNAQKVNVNKSLNDRLKANTLNIGLNDKLAFIKHLFDGKLEDYERVLSQINTAASFDEASKLVQNIVKPDYKNWIGKEEVEERFMEIIESKFNV